MDLDLNIENYATSEVEALFGLMYPYTLNDILQKETHMIEVIAKDKTYSVQHKTNFVAFMKKAKGKLISRLQREIERQMVNDVEEDVDELLIPSDIGKVVNQTTAVQIGGNSFVLNQETNTLNDMTNPNKYLNPIETFPTNIARSNLNNLKRKTVVQTVILNSLFREDYKNTISSDFLLILPYQFKNVLSIRLSSIQLPNVLYCFSTAKLNNIMFIEENGDDPGARGTVLLPDGNYTLSGLAFALQHAINEQLQICPPRFIVTAQEHTQKITISNLQHTFSMNFFKDVESIDFNSTMGWILGFRNIEYNYSGVYTGEAIYNSVASDYIFFVLNDFNNSQSQNILAMYSKSYIGNNILAMIPLTSNSFHICFDNGSDFIEKKRDYFGPVNLQRLKIELRNQYGELLDLNQMDFSFSLEVELGYDW